MTSILPATSDIRLDREPRIIQALTAGIGAPRAAQTSVTHGHANRDHIDYDARHVLPFLLDAFLAFPPDLRLGWFGTRADLLARFSLSWRALGFTAPIMVADGLGRLPAGTIRADIATIAVDAGAFVFDFAPAAAQETVADGLRAMAAAEDVHLENPLAIPRRFVAVNAVLNQWESLVASVVGAASAPLATRLRQGVRHRPTSLPAAILDRLHPGAAGIRTGPAPKSVA